MTTLRRRTFPALTAVVGLLATAPVADAARTDYGRQTLNILTPGETGILPVDAHSTDQLKLYDALTPRFGDVGRGDLARFFKSERLGARGTTTVEETGRDGLTILRDSYGVAHVKGEKRSDVMFGAGWVTAKDRGLLLDLGRGPARAAVASVPSLNAFGLITSAKTFIPSAQAEALITRQHALIRKLGRKGRQMLQDFDDYAAGINAYRRSINHPQPNMKRNDVIAITAFIGDLFGAGGGDEVRNSAFLGALRAQLGPDAGRQVFGDLMGWNDPEAPVSAPKSFPYNRRPRGAAPGSLVVDPGSVQFVPDPSLAGAAPKAGADRLRPDSSNALLVAGKRSRSGHPLAVMGPQLGYFYPELVHEVDLDGPGIHARGSAVPGAGMYILIGRAQDYAWSLTSAGSDNVDQYLEELCNPDGSPPTRESTHYRHRGQCRAMGTFNAGTLKTGPTDPGKQLVFSTTVHGPVQGTATVGGQPYAISRRRSTYGREGLSLAALKDMTEGRVRSAKDFARFANEFEFTFNWLYIDDRDIAFFSSGRLPIRAPGVDPVLPTLGTGDFEWRGFLSRDGHPQAINPKSGYILNWNNKAAPDFSHGDDTQSYGSVQRVELFKRFRKRNQLHDVVAVMNRAATQDLRAVEIWPVIRDVLAGGPAPDQLTRQAADLVTAWLSRGASRLDRNLDGTIDDPGAAVLDAVWTRLSDAVLGPVLGPELDQLRSINGRDNHPAISNGSAFGGGWYGYIEKDLRTILGRSVRGKYSRVYCGGGNLNACRDSLWSALQEAANELAASQGGDPNAWRADATRERIRFTPGLLPDTMRWTNRPTFQQALEFDGHR